MITQQYIGIFKQNDTGHLSPFTLLYSTLPLHYSAHTVLLQYSINSVVLMQYSNYHYTTVPIQYVLYYHTVRTILPHSTYYTITQYVLYYHTNIFIYTKRHNSSATIVVYVVQYETTVLHSIIV